MRNGDHENEPEAVGSNSDSLAPPDLPGITLTPAPLSRGPFSAVYRGWDRVHRYDVIVKVLQTAGDPVAADRFRREAAVMARLRHPNIVALYHFHDGNPSALVMEYVPGQTLDALIAADGQLPVARTVQIVEEIAAALDCIHAENVVHRDVKPSNILLPKHGPARLTDFGVAHIDTSTPLTIRGDMLGTIEYASPEQVQGVRAPDARSDVYSLAAVAYFALAGTPPFPATDSSMQSHLSVMHQQVFSEPPPLRTHREDIAPGIDAAVRRGLAKTSTDRYPSAGQFASALRSAVVAASGAPEKGAIAVSSRRTLALSGALACAALLAGGSVLVWNRDHASQTAAQTHPSRQLASAPPAVAPVAPAPEHPAVVPPKAKAAAVKPKPVQVAALPIPAAHAVLHHRTIAAVPHPRIAAAVPHHPTVAAVPKRHFLAVVPVRVAKRAVIERPKFRRHPVLVAAGIKPVRHPIFVHPALASAAPRSASVKLAWLSVYARQDAASLGRGTQTIAIPAQEVTVDGHPLPTLASGGYAGIPAGKHLIAFVPSGQSGYGRSPGVWVTLAPGAKVSRQILLPIASPLLATTRTYSRAPLTASAAPARPVVPIQPLVPAPIVSSPVTPQIAAAVIPAAVGWYTVSGWIVHNPAAPKPTLIRTSAYWVKVDGVPNLPLAMGQWAELPAGKHTVTFQPTNGVGVGAKTWNIDLSPQAHLDQQIPLPPMIVTPQ